MPTAAACLITAGVKPSLSPAETLNNAREVLTSAYCENNAVCRKG